MSLGAVNAVLANSKASGAARMVAFVLAHHANKQGVSFPKQSTIAEEAGVDVRTVQRALDWLVENGEFVVEPRPKHCSFHQYRCLLTGSDVASETVKTGSDVASETWKRDQMSPPNGSDVASETYQMSPPIGTTKELPIELKGEASPEKQKARSESKSKSVASEVLEAKPDRPVANQPAQPITTGANGGLEPGLELYAQRLRASGMPEHEIKRALALRRKRAPQGVAAGGSRR